MNRPKYKPIYLEQKAKSFRGYTFAFIVAVLAYLALNIVGTRLHRLEGLNEGYYEHMERLMEENIRLKDELELRPADDFFPSDNTIKIMNNNTGMTAKIHKKFGVQWMKWAELIARESGFNKRAINPTSGACGLSQALPCSKMACSLDDADCQLNWIEEYVNDRYGSIDRTLVFHDLRNYY